MIYDDKNTMTRRDVIRGAGAVTIASRYGRAGVPVVLDGTIVGAVGASAGTVEQDIEVAEAAITALSHQAQSSDDLRQPPSET